MSYAIRASIMPSIVLSVIYIFILLLFVPLAYAIFIT
jgi:hypothetical protein